MTDIPFTSINDIAVVLNNAMDSEESLNTTTAAMNLDSYSVTATTTTITMYTPFLDISTIASDPSPVTLSSETLSHLSWELLTVRLVCSQQEAVEIATWEHAPKNQANFILKIYDLLCDFAYAANAQVAWLANCAERNLNWEKLKYKQYNDFLKALDSSCRVREMIKQHQAAQQTKTWATMKLEDLWQHNPELQGMLSNSGGSEKWMELTAIAKQTSRDAGLAKPCLNCPYVNRHAKLKKEVENEQVVYFRRLSAS